MLRVSCVLVWIGGFLAITLTFDSSPIKGEGDWLVVLSCSPASPPYGYCLEASMSLRHGRIQLVLSVACHCPSGLRIKSAMT